MQRKTQLAVAVGAALLAAGTAQAQVTGAQQGINVQLYGQVHRAVMHADDGVRSKWFHVDGQPSSTRIGINASAPVTPGLRIGARIETEMKSNPSNAVNFATPSIANTFVERWLDAYAEGAWGRVTMGQGSGAADDVSTLNLSGTGMANGTCPTDWGGGIPFVNSAGVAVTGGLGTATGLGDCNDFESRYDRLRYTSPTFAGFRAEVSTGQKSVAGEANEAALWYTGKLAGDFQAAVGWSNQNTGTAAGVPDRETIGFGVAWLHTSGFNVAANWTEVDGVAQVAGDDRKGTTTWLGVGYKFGQHAIGLDYGIYDDIAGPGDEGKSYGVGYVWSPTRWSEIYAGYHMFTLDRPTVSLEDITVFAIGTRVRF